MITIRYTKSVGGSVDFKMEVPDNKVQEVLDGVDRAARSLAAGAVLPLPASDRLANAAVDLLDAIVREVKRG